MPIKLQVVKEDDDGEPADYLFEQDRITIGRGSNNDLTLPDQKVSTEHAEIRNDEGTYLLLDRDSKNKTFVNGRRVGEAEPYTLSSGDVFRVGDFKIEFAPLFMPSSEQTAYAEENEDANPFSRHTSQLAAALEGLAETYKFTPPEGREASFAEAVNEHLDPDLAAEEGVQRVLKALGAGQGGAPDPSASQAAAGDAADTSAVLDSLLESVARMISIPSHFWREFTGNDLDHPPEKQVLYDADVDDLREHLLDEDIPEAERNERLQHLSDAVESLVAHNMAMLVGYRKSVMAGSKELLRRVSPLDAIDQAEEEGGMMSFFGGGDTSEIERLEQRWRDLVRGEWGEVEQKYFRPTYIDAYVDRMAETWELDRAEILSDDQS